MGLILDIVPNHMGIDDESNRWWWDVPRERPQLSIRQVLRHRLGAAQGRPGEKVLLPILGDQYGKVLENGEIQLLCRGRGFLHRLL